MRAWKALKSAAVILAVTVVFDVSLAQLCKGRCDQILHSEHRKKYRVKHPVYHHDLLPNVSVMGRWGKTYYPIFTNSMGFKDRGIRNVPLKSDRARILFIGDSFTEGQGMTYEKTFVGLIGDALAEKGVEVLNAAVSSYAPAVYFAKVKYLIETTGLEIDHVMVFIDISDIDDEAHWYRVGDDGIVGTLSPEGERVARRAFGKGLVAKIRENSLIAQFLYILRDNIVYYSRRRRDRPRTLADPDADYDLDLWIEKTTNLKEVQWIFDPKADQAWGRTGVANAVRNMTRLHSLLQRHGIGLTVAIYPWPDNIILGDMPSPHSRVWQDWSTDRGVDLVDMFPDFIGPLPAKETLTTYFIPYDVHWNELGHRFVAERILGYLRSSGILSGLVERKGG